MANPLLNTKRFLPLFMVLFFNAASDNILKNAILVMVAYQGMQLFSLDTHVSINLISLLFILPFFLFSSIAGKLADMYNKVFIIKIIKFCEIGIILVAIIGFIYHSLIIMTLALFLMGVHSTFFGPIKYSILPQYISVRKDLLLANGYVELCTFIAVLVGQFLGSWYAASGQLDMVMILLVISVLVSLGLTYRMENTVPESEKIPLNINIIKDTWQTYRQIMSNRDLRINIHALSWFWALGIIYTTQLPLFTKEYMGGCASVFSIILVIFSVAIGIGSVVCGKLANGQIKHHYIIFGSAGMSLFSLILLAINTTPVTACSNLAEFSQSLVGMSNYLLIFLIGFSGGFYSVTCYNQLQIISPRKILSQVIAVNNIANAGYMVIAASVCTLLLIWASLWTLFVVLIIANLAFSVIYWYKIRVNTQAT